MQIITDPQGLSNNGGVKDLGISHNHGDKES